MKVKITGNVIGPNGKLSGIVVLPSEEAERLLRLNCAVRVVDEDPIPAPGETVETKIPEAEEDLGADKNSEPASESEETVSKFQNSKKKKN